jgi:hypothetical protein
MYAYGKINHMKTTMNIDSELIRKAKAACNASTNTKTVELGLKALVERAAAEELRKFLGSEPDAQDVPRRREPPPRATRRRKRVA